MEQVTKLTVLQSEVGYKPGEIDIVAILGLFAEAGELLDEWYQSVVLKKSYPSRIDTEIVDAVVTAIETAKEIDQIKKNIRDGKIENPFEKHEELSPEFDKEHSDVFYYLNAICINRKTTINKLAHTAYEKVISKSVEKNIITEQDASVIENSIEKLAYEEKIDQIDKMVKDLPMLRDKYNDGVSLVSVNKLIQTLPNEKVGFVSDGYHTFNELYDHRCINYIAVCKMFSLGSLKPWVSLKDSEGKEMGDWFLLGIQPEEGQITYHIPMKYWNLCSFAKKLDKAPDFDGHTSEDVLNRMIELFK